MNPYYWILKKFNNPSPDGKYNILTYPTHEGYHTLLSKTGHNFYLYNRPNAKRWETKYRELPENHYEIEHIYPDDNIDFILSQERFGSLQMSLQLQMATRLPIIHLEHVEPQVDRWGHQQFQDMKKMRGDINIFITEHNGKSWGHSNPEVIHHGIDTSLFRGWKREEKPYVLYVVNELRQRDYFCGYHEWKKIKDLVQEAYPQVEFRLVGDNGDMGHPAKDMDELIQHYRGCLCYINTSKLSPVPMSLLEAMATGCPVVTTAKQYIPNIVKDGENGYCSNDIDYLASRVLSLVENKVAARAIGSQARKTIKEKFSLGDFVNNWNRVFNRAYDMKFGNACLKKDNERHEV